MRPPQIAERHLAELRLMTGATFLALAPHGSDPRFVLVESASTALTQVPVATIQRALRLGQLAIIEQRSGRRIYRWLKGASGGERP